MRRLLIWGALAAVTMLPGEPARAQVEGPWCLQANMGRSVSERCHFRTFESCRDERPLYGSTAFCTQNPRYLPYWQGRSFGEQPRQQVSHKKKKKKHRRH